MTIESKQFGFAAWLTGLVALVYLGGSVFALSSGAIGFTEFSTAVGIPLGPLIGWVARGFAK